MGSKMSYEAVQQLRGKIQAKVTGIRAGWKLDQQRIFKETVAKLGLTEKVKLFEKALAEETAAQKKKHRLGEEISKALGFSGVLYPNHLQSVHTLLGVMQKFIKARADLMTEREANLPGAKKVERLEELLNTLELRLEMVSSTKEIKELVEGILKELE
jgi:hypothetical protein